MTNEERQTVIDALKLGLENTRLSQSEPILRALAIMRREPVPAEIPEERRCSLCGNIGWHYCNVAAALNAAKD